ncbi:hypothetical protein GGQ84_000446 [Desulfitispora alkaliphila]|uniref:hypothetical protein n=1 Tax=Desulfitispora alkaliphila TaxID=622674 RepID=UPI003D1A5C17
MFSTAFWIALAIPTVILLGGLYIWLTRKPETKPNLAMRMNETEAQILDEIDDEEGEDLDDRKI